MSERKAPLSPRTHAPPHPPPSTLFPLQAFGDAQAVVIISESAAGKGGVASAHVATLMKGIPDTVHKWGKYRDPHMGNLGIHIWGIWGRRCEYIGNRRPGVYGEREGRGRSLEMKSLNPS